MSLSLFQTKTKYDRMFQKRNQDILSEHYNKLVDYEGDKLGDGDDDDFMTIGRADHALESDSDDNMKVSKSIVKGGERNRKLKCFLIGHQGR
jgi:ATP-dependent RNA helicase DDX10/DBP4